MVKVIVDVDCGNSPKMLFLKEFMTAFATGDIAFITASVSSDITWNIVGVQTIVGKTAFVASLERIDFSENATVTITRIITHGKEAAVNGEITTTGGKRIAFCDVYEFSSAHATAIKVIESFNIKIAPT